MQFSTPAKCPRSKVSLGPLYFISSRLVVYLLGAFSFPGQENGDHKIPSILWYTQNGDVRAAGAEARDPGMTLVAEDEDLILVEW